MRIVLVFLIVVVDEQKDKTQMRKSYTARVKLRGKKKQQHRVW